MADVRRLAGTNALIWMGPLLLATLLLRILWLNRTGNALIFDEAYYVNAARVILHVPLASGAHYYGQPMGIDPNWEHAPLGKLLIAGSMWLFGDDPLGWRLPSIILGTASVGLLYLIVRAAGGSGWMGLLASTLFSFDNLVFVHGRIGTLDMPLLFFLMLAAWFTLLRLPIAAGAAGGLAALVKITAWYGIAALILFEVAVEGWRWYRNRNFVWQPVAIRVGALVGSFIVVSLVGLWILDSNVGHFKSPFDHLSYMLTYGLKLTRPSGPAGIESYPWQWLANEVQIPYYRVDQNIFVNGKIDQTRPIIWFRGAMNPMIIGPALLGIGYSVWRAWKFGDVLAIWVVTWFAANYLPYYPLAMGEHRISYIFYFLLVMPAVTVSLAQFLLDRAVPRWVLVAYLISVFIGFLAYFPFRTL